MNYEKSALNELRIDAEGKRIEMANGLLTVSFSLSAPPGPLPDAAADKWYAGSANSVRSDNIEMLEFFRHHMSRFEWIGHDKEKRTMQIQRLTIYDPRLGSEGCSKVNIFDLEYNLLKLSHDPTMCSMLVQCPLDFKVPGSLSMQRMDMKFHLNRRLTLCSKVKYVLEEVWVTMSEPQNKPDMPPQRVEFVSEFFACADIGRTPSIKKDLSKGWFSVAWIGDNEYAPRLGFGFGCDQALLEVVSPVTTYPFQERAYKTYTWKTSRCTILRAVHLFTHGKTTDADGALIRELRSELPKLFPN
jgi:hypothetical protein